MRAVVLLLVLALSGCATSTATPTPTPTPVGSALPLTAYQGEWSDPAAITTNATHISLVAVDGLNLSGPGEVPQPSVEAVAQLTAAHDAGLPAEIMLGNYNAGIEDFDEKLAWQTLGDEKAIQDVVNSVSTAVTEQGWDGVSVDLESLTARDTQGLSLLLASLRQALGPEKSISIALMLADTPEGYAALGYNLPAISAVVDRVILMAYDEHGPWDAEPGPIGSLTWQISGLQAILTAIPASQLELGIARYGYYWGPDGAGSITIADARTRAGAAATFDPNIGDWTATLADGTVLWWSDADSFDLRVILARQFQLSGLAIWELGDSDPLR
jgi:spore germination protein